MNSCWVENYIRYNKIDIVSSFKETNCSKLYPSPRFSVKKMFAVDKTYVCAVIYVSQRYDLMIWYKVHTEIIVLTFCKGSNKKTNLSFPHVNFYINSSVHESYTRQSIICMNNNWRSFAILLINLFSACNCLYQLSRTWILHVFKAKAKTPCACKVINHWRFFAILLNPDCLFIKEKCIHNFLKYYNFCQQISTMMFTIDSFYFPIFVFSYNKNRVKLK